MNDDDALNALNEKLKFVLNDSGRLYLSHTKLNGVYTLRLVMGQTQLEEKHVKEAWNVIRETAQDLSA